MRFLYFSRSNVFLTFQRLERAGWGRKEVSCLQPRAVSVVEDLVEGPALTTA